jgi:hypothetical protein
MVNATAATARRTVLSEPETIDVCTLCGAISPTGDLDATIGWRWFSDGRGGLAGLCPACPTPLSLLAESQPPLLAA